MEADDCAGIYDSWCLAAAHDRIQTESIVPT
jgi:hypothetical protein